MIDGDAIRRFFDLHVATFVGGTPMQPLLSGGGEDEEGPEPARLDIELGSEEWKAITVPEAPARKGEYPERFIDGSMAGEPVLCLRAPTGWPIPLFLAEVGAVALRLSGRGFEREFVEVERVLSFVADPFPWDEVEAFSTALANDREMPVQVVRANPPNFGVHSPFDYEAMRNQARAAAAMSMRTWERLALFHDRSVPTLIDGPLLRITGDPDPQSPLIIAVTKSHSAAYLHDQGWRTLLGLRPGQRTPAFQLTGLAGDRESHFRTVSWFLKLAGGNRLAPNWGYVRVEVPWRQFERFGGERFSFINRLSRWLIDARCRQESYARMPVSLEPIVRAEDALKPLFTPLSLLTNRLYRRAGMTIRSEES